MSSKQPHEILNNQEQGIIEIDICINEEVDLIHNH